MRSHEAESVVQAPVDAVFAHIDDPVRLSAHMSKSSWMMGGGRMSVEVDERRGQAVGSTIRLQGRVLGLRLAVEEIVTERNPPLRKVWQTIGTPRLLVIGHYRMGFELAPLGSCSGLRVFIDYSIPPGSWPARLLGHYYAQWCVHRMISDAVRHYAARAKEPGLSR